MESGPLNPGRDGGPVLALVDADLGPVGASAAVLTGVDLELLPGQAGVLLGPNGSGKTTLLRTAAGFWPVRRGTLRSPSRDGFDPTRTGLILEDPASQFVAGTVERELAFALESRGLEAAAIRERVRRILAVHGLERLGGRNPRSLSPGEQQRCLLAAALAPEPDLLLLDDPFLYLGPGDRRAAWHRVREAVGETRIRAVLLATHDPEPALEADRVGILHGGGLLWWGQPDAIFREAMPSGIDVPLGVWLCRELEEAGWTVPEGGWTPGEIADRLAGARA